MTDPSGKLKDRIWKKWVTRRILRDSFEDATDSATAQEDKAEGNAIASPKDSKSRLDIEEEGRIELPANTDILLVTGKPFNVYPGNVAYRGLLISMLEKYSSFVRTKERTAMSSQMVKNMKESGARFLRLDNNGWWVPASEGKAVEWTTKRFSIASKALKMQPSNDIAGNT